MYEAVSALAGSCQSLRSVIERKDPDIIGDALTPFLGLWPNIYVGTTAADYLTKSELQELADLRVKSVKVIKGSVVIDVVKKDSPESARLVMEKHEEAWRIKRQIGRLFPIDISKKPIKKGSDLPGETPELPWTFV